MIHVGFDAPPGRPLFINKTYDVARKFTIGVITLRRGDAADALDFEG